MPDLSRVFWLSGSPCGGKTTISDVLASRYNWNVYHVDNYWDSHKQRSCPIKQPAYHAISHITGDDLWLRPVEEQIKSEPIFVAESFSFILEDVEELLRQDERVLIVDASVVPESILHLLPTRRHIFYLIPEEGFQLLQYSQRPSIKTTLGKTTDPELAWANWMTRDAAYARWLTAEVQKENLPHLIVDGTVSLEETIALVADHYCGTEGSG